MVPFTENFDYDRVPPNFFRWARAHSTPSPPASEQYWEVLRHFLLKKSDAERAASAYRRWVENNCPRPLLRTGLRPYLAMHLLAGLMKRLVCFPEGLAKRKRFVDPMNPPRLRNTAVPPRRKLLVARDTVSKLGLNCSVVTLGARLLL